MDWLTADLVLKAITTAAVGIVLCVICGSALFWFCCDEGRRDLRMKWRVWQERKRQERARQIQAEWNPRSTAMRGEFGSARGRAELSRATGYCGKPINGSSADASHRQGDPLRIVRPSAG